MKSFTIEKICSLPIDFKTTNKSPRTLAKESKFQEAYKEITTKDISNYLTTHKTLIDKWKMWSQDNEQLAIGYRLQTIMK